MKPRAAVGSFPYPHRTVAEVDHAARSPVELRQERIAELDRISRERALTDQESNALYCLLRRAA
jgi:hypothetical protein